MANRVDFCRNSGKFKFNAMFHKMVGIQASSRRETALRSRLAASPMTELQLPTLMGNRAKFKNKANAK